MGFFKNIFEGRPADKDQAEPVEHMEQQVAESGHPQEARGLVGMQHFGYKRVDGMDSRYPQGGGPDRQAERLSGEDFIRRKQEELADSGAEDADRIRRIREQIEAVRRDMNRG